MEIKNDAVSISLPADQAMMYEIFSYAIPNTPGLEAELFEAFPNFMYVARNIIRYGSSANELQELCARCIPTYPGGWSKWFSIVCKWRLLT